MAGDEAQPSRSEDRVEAIIGNYLEALAAGTAPDRQELLARHPDLAADLAVFFANHDRMQQLVSPQRQAGRNAVEYGDDRPSVGFAPGRYPEGLAKGIPCHFALNPGKKARGLLLTRQSG